MSSNGDIPFMDNNDKDESEQSPLRSSSQLSVFNSDDDSDNSLSPPPPTIPMRYPSSLVDRRNVQFSHISVPKSKETSLDSSR